MFSCLLCVFKIFDAGDSSVRNWPTCFEDILGIYSVVVATCTLGLHRKIGSLLFSRRFRSREFEGDSPTRHSRRDGI